MEVIAVVALAGNVLQFVESGAKVTKYVGEILRSDTSDTSRVAGLVTLEKQLNSLAQYFLATSKVHASSATEEAKLLQTVTEGCITFLDQIKPVLAGLRCAKDTPTFKKICKALKTLRKEKELRDMAENLASLGGQVGLCVQSIARYDCRKSTEGASRLTPKGSKQQETLIRQVSRISEDAQTHFHNTTNQLDAMGRDIRLIAQRLLNLSVQNTGPPAVDITVQAAEKETESIESLALRLAESVALFENHHQELCEAAVHRAVLRSLHFDTIAVRHEQIPEAAERTYQWIFDDSSTTFPGWLTSGHGMYWITGKAGCGKSTLMKFIADNVLTLDKLQEWSSTELKSVTVASFYFWRFGTSKQKSILGLLQSILYAILQNIPALVAPVMMKRRYKASVDDSAVGVIAIEGLLRTPERISWSESDLIAAIHICKDQLRFPTKLCFFIDGLDEYDGHHLDAISLLQSLVCSEDIKICVSSRPENAFRLAFGVDTNRTFQLHWLTEPDIRTYVETKLTENIHFQKACNMNQDLLKLVPMVTEKAEGVFLWVRLAVHNLLEGLLDDATLDEIKSRLQKLPGELESLYKFMLDSVEDHSRHQAEDIFRFCISSPHPPLVMSIPWVGDTVGQANDTDIAQSPTGAAQIYSRAFSRLNARCKGLMEEVKVVDCELFTRHNPWRPLIFYRCQPIHATVLEFLEKHLCTGEAFENYRQTQFTRHRFNGILQTIRLVPNNGGIMQTVLLQHVVEAFFIAATEHLEDESTWEYLHQLIFDLQSTNLLEKSAEDLRNFHWSERKFIRAETLIETAWSYRYCKVSGPGCVHIPTWSFVLFFRNQNIPNKYLPRLIEIWPVFSLPNVTVTIFYHNIVWQGFETQAGCGMIALVKRYGIQALSNKWCMQGVEPSPVFRNLNFSLAEALMVAISSPWQGTAGLNNYLALMRAILASLHYAQADNSELNKFTNAKFDRKTAWITVAICIANKYERTERPMSDESLQTATDLIQIFLDNGSDPNISSDCPFQFGFNGGYVPLGSTFAWPKTAWETFLFWIGHSIQRFIYRPRLLIKTLSCFIRAGAHLNIRIDRWPWQRWSSLAILRGNGADPDVMFPPVIVPTTAEQYLEALLETVCPTGFPTQYDEMRPEETNQHFQEVKTRNYVHLWT